MRSAGTMNDHSQRRRPHGDEPRDSAELGGLRLPLGRWGVGLVFALALGLFGLLMPQSLLETISFQLYLDRITDAALPPLGTTARIVAALAFAAGGVLFGWILGGLFGVSASDFSFDSLMNRLRGVGDGDEDDAPVLRSADRHPDAPARRPFSAARDIAADEDDWLDEDEDALLLDTQFASADEVVPPAPPLGADRGTSYDQMWRDVADERPSAPSPAPAAPAIAARPIMPQPSGIDEDSDSVSLPAPSLDDWEVGPAGARVIPPPPFPPAAPVAPPPFATRQPESAAPAPVAPAEPPRAVPAPELASVPAFAPAPSRSSLPPVEPLDLSAARLDDLLSRLESGLSRRGGAMPPAPSAASVAGLTADAPVDAGRPLPSPAAESGPKMAETAPPAIDPAYPHDPALAAALKTLRRLNQQATA